jgi:Icc-related predicted phosphoesterase
VGILRARRPDRLRIFYAADLHGSEPAFRKFVNAAGFYDVDVLVFGGDLMGKAMVPIVSDGPDGGYRARFMGADHEIQASGLTDFTRTVEVTGFYHRVMGPDEYAWLNADPLAQRSAFIELAAERLRRWIVIAEERMARAGARMFLTGGNDDEPEVLRALDEADGEVVVPAEHRAVELDDRHAMITVGYSTPTPWDTPREVSEGEMAAAIDRVAGSLAEPGFAVFNLHAPPKDTILDVCLKLEASSIPGALPQPIREGGRFVTTGGGSSAVTEAIRRYQPAVSLHGHIHESPGRLKLKRTYAFNPGSEYAQGHLEGVIVTLKAGKVVGYQHTSG